MATASHCLRATVDRWVGLADIPGATIVHLFVLFIFCTSSVLLLLASAAHVSQTLFYDSLSWGLIRLCVGHFVITSLTKMCAYVSIDRSPCPLSDERQSDLTVNIASLRRRRRLLHGFSASLWSLARRIIFVGCLALPNLHVIESYVSPPGMASLGIFSPAISLDVADGTIKRWGLRGCASVCSSSDSKFGRSQTRDDRDDLDDGNDHCCDDQCTQQITLVDDALGSLGWFPSIILSTYALMPATCSDFGMTLAVVALASLSGFCLWALRMSFGAVISGLLAFSVVTRSLFIDPFRYAMDLMCYGPGASVLDSLLGNAQIIGRPRPPQYRWLSGLHAVPLSLSPLSRKLMVLSSTLADHCYLNPSALALYCWHQSALRSRSFWNFTCSFVDCASRFHCALCRQSVPVVGPHRLALLGLNFGLHFLVSAFISMLVWLSLFVDCLSLSTVCILRFFFVVRALLHRAAGVVAHACGYRAIQWIGCRLVSSFPSLLQAAATKRHGSTSYKTRRAVAYYRRASAGKSWLRAILFFGASLLSLRQSDSALTPTSLSAPPAASHSPSVMPDAVALDMNSAALPADDQRRRDRGLIDTQSIINRSDLQGIVQSAMASAADKFGLNEVEKKKYLSCARIFVVEVVHDSVFRIINYRRVAGEMGGLNKIKRPHIKRIVLSVDSPEGLYGAAYLQKYIHYQIGIEELGEFYDDLARMNLPLHNAAVAPLPEVGCSVLCLPDKSHVLEDEYFSLGAVDFCSDSCSNVLKELNPSKIFHFLSSLSDDSFDRDRGNLCINFGWRAMNCTDTSRDDLCGFSAPTLGNPSGDGWSGSRADDLASAMAAMTKLTDHATGVLGLPPLFGSASDARVTQYALKIHPENRAESVTLSLAAVGGGKYLLAHLDHLNDHADGWQYNVSYYGYHRPPGSSELRRMHIGIYSRRACGTTSERSGRVLDLLDDLTNFLGILPKRRVEYSPESVLEKVEWEREVSGVSIKSVGTAKGSSPISKAAKKRRRQKESRKAANQEGEEIGRIPVHTNKFVLYSFYATTIVEWIEERSSRNCPVSVP